MQLFKASSLSCALVVLLAGRHVAAAPRPQGEECEPRILCIDGINKCGVRYGGCYDVCDKAARPSAPPCPQFTTITSIFPITSTTATIVTQTPPAENNCSSQTVCWDGINSCGMTYGGPWPTFAAPPCATTEPTVTSVPGSLPTPAPVL
ncbi:hypothetical protein B0T26DRAFT_867479 [Lasiosphaeria miniovina]|uniref:Uncharacterized protein n=1 Tax=Lasiosphaeria miniovina TaxID=1954250 RepID=A0AA40BHM4_9PEZI|nr:uncharacterized protein B0T26DRAFT_867479 [Lasiosphaeria miniovina]KAK0734397.1 hypothetical protein B0T26DRAFT_867479 [Lasiosphaeria miniovina]